MKNMNRSLDKISKFMLLIILLIGSMGIFDAAKAELPAGASLSPMTGGFVEGRNYQRLGTDITLSKTIQEFLAENTHKIQVLEFFSYGCYGCSQVHPVLTEWAKTKPDNVVFYRFPLGFNGKWDILARAYYVAEALGKVEEFDPLFFKAIHVDHVDLSNDEAVKKFFISHRIPEKTVNEIYQSFNVNRALKKSTAIADAYKISLSPVVVVNGPSGSYLLTVKMAGTKADFVSVINYLINHESQKLPGV